MVFLSQKCHRLNRSACQLRIAWRSSGPACLRWFSTATHPCRHSIRSRTTPRHRSLRGRSFASRATLRWPRRPCRRSASAASRRPVVTCRCFPERQVGRQADRTTRFRYWHVLAGNQCTPTSMSSRSRYPSTADPLSVNFNMAGSALARGTPVFSFCSFCKTNKETKRVYESHTLHDSANRVVCPALRCFATFNSCVVWMLPNVDITNKQTFRYCFLNLISLFVWK